MKHCINWIAVLMVFCALVACTAKPGKDRAQLQEERAEAFWNRLGAPADAR